MRRLVIAAVVALAAAPLAAWAAAAPAPPLPPGVTLKLAPERVRLGEPFHYLVSVTRPAKERFDLAPPKDLGAFSLRGLSRRRVDGPTSATTTFDLTLALYDLGAQPLPRLSVDAVMPSGRTELVVAGPAVSAIVTTKPGDELRDISGPVRVFESWWAPLWIALGASLLAAVLVLGMRRWPRRQRSLEERSRMALGALAQAQLVEADRTQEFFFSLDDIVRRHLGERFALDALECTTRELIVRLQGIDALASLGDELVGFLRHADLVKFARASADRARSDEALAFAYRLVALPAAQRVEKGVHAHLAVS